VTKTIRLPEGEPNLFAIFLTWICTGTIENAEELPTVTGITKDQKEASLNNQYLQLACCYAMGDALAAEAYRNTLMDILVQNQRHFSAEHAKKALTAGIHLDY